MSQQRFRDTVTAMVVERNATQIHSTQQDTKETLVCTDSETDGNNTNPTTTTQFISSNP